MQTVTKSTYVVSFLNGQHIILINDIVKLVVSISGLFGPKHYFLYALKDGKCYTSDTKNLPWKGVDDYVKNGRPDIYKVLTNGQILKALSLVNSENNHERKQSNRNSATSTR